MRDDDYGPFTGHPMDPRQDDTVHLWDLADELLEDGGHHVPPAMTQQEMEAGQRELWDLQMEREREVLAAILNCMRVGTNLGDIEAIVSYAGLKDEWEAYLKMHRP